MNKENYYKLIEEMNQKITAIHKKKTLDYASEEDVLSNFKRVGTAIELLDLKSLPPQLFYSFTLMILKLDRITNLLKRNIAPNNESIEDSFTDLLNYGDLSYALYKEMNK